MWFFAVPMLILPWRWLTYSSSSLRVIDLSVVRGLSVARNFEKFVSDCSRLRQVPSE
jgi:hypothetical protein